MTTFQAVVYAAIHGFTEFLPVSAEAHARLLSHFTSWALPGDALAGAFSLGAFFSLLVYFRHDWASILSCFLQVIIYRKKPMTLDERLPFFLALTALPIGIAGFYFPHYFSATEWTPPLIAALLAAFGIALWLSEFMGRKNKGMLDLSWMDTLFLGLFGALSWLPGCGQMTAILFGAQFRNYRIEAAAKYSFFALAPMLALSTFLKLRDVDFHSAAPMAGLSWLSFFVALAVTFLTGMLAIGGFMRQVQRKRIGSYTIYRLLLALGVAAHHWLQQ